MVVSVPIHMCAEARGRWQDCPLTLFTVVPETWFFTKSEAHTILGFVGRATQGPVIPNTMLPGEYKQAGFYVCVLQRASLPTCHNRML